MTSFICRNTRSLVTFAVMWLHSTTNGHSPFLICILQIRGGEAEFKFSDIFGVIDTGREHLRQVGCESGQALGQMGIKALVEKDNR